MSHVHKYTYGTRWLTLRIWHASNKTRLSSESHQKGTRMTVITLLIYTAVFLYRSHGNISTSSETGNPARQEHAMVVPRQGRVGSVSSASYLYHLSQRLCERWYQGLIINITTSLQGKRPIPGSIWSWSGVEPIASIADKAWRSDIPRPRDDFDYRLALLWQIGGEHLAGRSGQASLLGDSLMHSWRKAVIVSPCRVGVTGSVVAAGSYWALLVLVS